MNHETWCMWVFVLFAFLGIAGRMKTVHESLGQLLMLFVIIIWWGEHSMASVFALSMGWRFNSTWNLSHYTTIHSLIHIYFPLRQHTRPPQRPREENRPTQGLFLLRHFRIHLIHHLRPRRIEISFGYLCLCLPRLHVLQGYWLCWSYRWHTMVDILGCLCPIFNHGECYVLFGGVYSILLFDQVCLLRLVVPPQVYGSWTCVQAGYQVCSCF